MSRPYTSSSYPDAHVYQGDGVLDHKREDRCVVCRMPRGKEWHDLPPTPEGDVSDRITGERSGVEDA